MKKTYEREEQYLKDVQRYVTELLPDIQQFFVDWVLCTFVVGDPIYIKQDVSSPFYSWNHSGYMAVSGAGKGTRGIHRPTEQQANGYSGLKARTHAITTQEAAIVKTNRRVTQDAKITELLPNYSLKGVTFSEVWQRECKNIASNIALSVASTYAKEYPDSLIRFMGLHAAANVEYAPVMLCEALRGAEEAEKVIREWSYHIPDEILSRTLEETEEHASERVADIRKNIRIYNNWARELKEKYKQEAMAVRLSEEEQSEKYFPGAKSKRFAMMRVRLSDRDLALAAWARRINCTEPVYAQLAAPIREEIQEQVHEAKKRYAPLRPKWDTKSFSIRQ